MSRANSRKHRGYRTQRVLADRWRASGLAPYAKPPGAGEGGNDMIDGPPGVAVEIKARTSVTLPSALKLAHEREPGKPFPAVFWRHDGQGEAATDQWTVTMSLVDWEALYRKAYGVRIARDLPPELERG